MLKVVLDTNLMIAGRWRKDSASNQIISLCIDGKVRGVYTHEIKDENLYILEKVKAPKEFLDRVLKYYRMSRKVNPGERVTLCSDPSDNRFLEAAVEAGADYIISSDHHLLDIKEFEGIPIVKPADFLRNHAKKG